MKTVGKRINPAFTVVQPLPLWPVAMAHRTYSAATQDYRAAAAQMALPPQAIAGALQTGVAPREFNRVSQTN